MRTLFTILLFLIYVNSFAQLRNNNPNVFNVKLFGAKGDGTTNDTRACQAAINAADAAGGGEVFFPNGIYIISDTLYAATSNSQLYIPFSQFTDASRNHITLMGESKPNFDPVSGGWVGGGSGIPVLTSGVILKSTLATVGAAGAAVIGTTGNGITGYNGTFLSVENIAIQVKNNPTGTGPVVGGISYKNGASMQCKNVVVYADTAGINTTLPSNDVTGIEMPDGTLEPFNFLENTLVQGFTSGYKLAEHTVLINAEARVCYYAFYMKFGGHTTTAVRALAQWCAYDLYITAYCMLSNFNLDAEWQQAGKWYDDIATIKDSTNQGHGQVYYQIIETGVAVNNSRFLKSGGANIHTLTIDEGVISQPIIGQQVGSSTIGSVLYVGTSNLLAQDNANLFYDGTNKRLGIGTASPTGNLEIRTAANPELILNTTDANGTPMLRYQKSGTTKFTLGIDRNSNGSADFWLYNHAVSLNQFLLDPTGVMFLGGAATTAATAGINITSAASVGIGVSPDASAKLHISSTTKGLLIPRQTVAERDAISSPANGLDVYNTDDSTRSTYKGSWENTPRIPRSSSIVTVDDTTTLDPGAGMPSSMKVWANANKRYRVTVSLWTVCSGTGGVCTGLSGPAGSAVLSGVWAGTAATASTTMQGTRSPAMNSTTTIGFNKIATASGSQTFIGYITTSSTAGFVTLTFRSLTLGQTSTLKVGSTMDLEEVL